MCADPRAAPTHPTPPSYSVADSRARTHGPAEHALAARMRADHLAPGPRAHGFLRLAQATPGVAPTHARSCHSRRRIALDSQTHAVLRQHRIADSRNVWPLTWHDGTPAVFVALVYHHALPTDDRDTAARTAAFIPRR